MWYPGAPGWFRVSVWGAQGKVKSEKAKVWYPGAGMVSLVGLALQPLLTTYERPQAVWLCAACPIGALVFAVSRSANVHSALAITETVSLFRVALAALVALNPHRRAQTATAIGFGLVWGTAALTRLEATLLFAPLLLLSHVTR